MLDSAVKICKSAIINIFKELGEIFSNAKYYLIHSTHRATQMRKG